MESNEHLTVALDIEISRELMFEGLARECVNKIQNIRKESGFYVTDKILLKAATKSPDLREMLENNLEYIKDEVLAESFEMEEKDQRSQNAVEFNGEYVSFEVVKQK